MVKWRWQNGVPVVPGDYVGPLPPKEEPEPPLPQDVSLIALLDGKLVVIHTDGSTTPFDLLEEIRKQNRAAQ
jgi:hypothetical protein